MPKDCVTLGQDTAIELDYRNGRGWIELGDHRLLVVWILLERVSDILVCDASILPQKTNDLSTASGLEVKVVNSRDAYEGSALLALQRLSWPLTSNLLVSLAGGTELLGRRHIEISDVMGIGKKEK